MMTWTCCVWSMGILRCVDCCLYHSIQAALLIFHVVTDTRLNISSSNSDSLSSTCIALLIKRKCTIQRCIKSSRKITRRFSNWASKRDWNQPNEPERTRALSRCWRNLFTKQARCYSGNGKLYSYILGPLGIESNHTRFHDNRTTNN